MKPIFCLWFLIVAANIFAQSDLPDLAKIKIAAEKGDPIAQEKLGEQYRNHQDSANSIYWYRRAAVQNNISAQATLGNILFMRYQMHLDAKPEDHAAVGGEAVKWISISAKAGNRDSEALFGQMYLNGEIIQKNYIEAYKWGELASRGSQFAPATISGKSVRDNAILKLTTPQIEEGRKRVDAFVPVIPTNTPSIQIGKP